MTNVVMITVDCLRADRLCSDGGLRELAPNIDRLAKRSLVFRKAYATGPRTAESFPGILASTYPMAIGGKWKLPVSTVPLSGVLQAAGYATGAFHSNPFLSTEYGYDRGFDQFWDSRQRTPVTSKVASRVMPKIDPNSSVYHFLRRLLRNFESAAGVAHYVQADEVTRRAAEWVSNQTQPFFLWIHYMDMHYPFSPPQAYLSQLNSSKISSRKRAELMNWYVLEDPPPVSASELQMLVDLYDAGLLFIDDVLGRFLNGLEQSGKMKDTILVVTGDHGEEFTEHGHFGHAGWVHESQEGKARIKLYEELLHVPLIIHAPSLGITPREVASLASLADLPPTIAGLLNLPAAGQWQGLDLTPAMRGEQMDLHAAVFSAYALRQDGVHSPIVSCRTRRWNYIHDGAYGNHELYDLENDPQENKNIFRADHPELPWLHQQVEEHLKLAEQSEIPVVDTQMDPELLERFRGLGYMN